VQLCVAKSVYIYIYIYIYVCVYIHACMRAHRCVELFKFQTCISTQAWANLEMSARGLYLRLQLRTWLFNPPVSSATSPEGLVHADSVLVGDPGGSAINTGKGGDTVKTCPCVASAATICLNKKCVCIWACTFGLGPGLPWAREKTQI